MIVILSWPSWSGKTTLDQYMKKLMSWWGFQQYSTRPIRPTEELEWSDYTYVSKEEMIWLLDDNKLIEFIRYHGNWEYYGIGLPKHYEVDGSSRDMTVDEIIYENICGHHRIVVATPVGKAILEEWFKLHNIACISVFLDVEKKTIIERLNKRWDNDWDIKKRLKDLSLFDKRWYDHVWIGEIGTHLLAQMLKKVADISCWIVQRVDTDQ